MPRSGQIPADSRITVIGQSKTGRRNELAKSEYEETFIEYILKLITSLITGALSNTFIRNLRTRYYSSI